jgi:hypothetical protein
VLAQFEIIIDRRRRQIFHVSPSNARKSSNRCDQS